MHVYKYTNKSRELIKAAQQQWNEREDGSNMEYSKKTWTEYENAMSI